ncbi:tonsoku-like protein [Antedon mediterranea]|uniref:tonsoku-like protein n=1 Tax=Antedon mediterranea TaxID=105859 RepID=UPI003AF68B44
MCLFLMIWKKTPIDCALNKYQIISSVHTQLDTRHDSRVICFWEKDYCIVWLFFMDIHSKKQLKRLQKDKLRAQSNGNFKQEAETCNAIGQLLATHGEYEAALEEHFQELQLSESLKDVIGSAVANRRIGECYCEMGLYKKALKYQQNHLEKAQSVDNRVEEQRALATIGRTYLLQSDIYNDKTEALNKAQEAFHGSLDICRELGGNVSDRELAEMKARLYLNLGLVYDSRQEAEYCAKFIKQAVYIAEQKNLHEDLYRAKISLAGIYIRDSKYSQAQRMYEGALQVAKKLADKYMESESIVGTANMYLQMGDFSVACKYFKQAYKLGSQTPLQREAVIANFKAAIRGRRLMKELSTKGKEDVKSFLRLYESLGDLYCKLTNYSKAIEYYQKQLECAKSLSKPEIVLIPIYVSLAATYTDNKQYEEAVNMYKHELQLRKGNHKEAGRTWLNIAKAQEDGGKHFALINSCLENALERARKAEHPRLQLRVLKESAAIQEKFVEDVLLEKTQRQLQEVKTKHDLDSEDDEISEDDSEETQNVEDESLDFTESEESEVDENEIVEGVRKRNKKPLFMRRNEKGETPLHRACIEGNVNLVKKYLEQGHPVNPRDHCGWTPLHESCNHGHYDIVALLLDHKANVNDPGGELCGMVTPLHDAINCGHFKVSELLISRGANLHAVDADGQTPLKALYTWEANYKHDLDKEARAACGRLKRVIDDVIKNGKSNLSNLRNTLDNDLFSAEDDSDPLLASQPEIETFMETIPSQRRSCLSRSANKRLSHQMRNSAIVEPEVDSDTDIRMEEEVALLNDADDPISLQTISTPEGILEDSEEVIPSPSPPVFVQEPDDVCDAYQQAINAVGSASSIISQRTPVRREPPQSTKEQPALIPDEIYAGDNWLVDDVGRQPGKRKRGSLDGIVTVLNSNSRVQNNASHSLTRSSRPPSSKRRRTKQLRLTNLQVTRERAPINIDSEDSLDSVTSQEEVSTTNRPIEDVSEQRNTPSASHEVTHSVEARRPVMRVRVKVKDKALAIPIPGTDKTMKWLTDQACQRYFNMCGVRPTLKLQTPEGAVFADEDIVTDSVLHNEEVIALVDSWDMPPLDQRYQRACQTAKIDENSKIVNAMQKCETSLELVLTNLNLGSLDLNPVITSLQLQHNLRHLKLHSNAINDALLQSLGGDVIIKLHNLVVLDLSCNLITHEGLRLVSDRFKKDGLGRDGSDSHSSEDGTRQKPFQLLEELDLSFNFLTDDSSLHLAYIVECCPRLTKLKLQSCDFTMKLFHRQFMDALKSLRHLESFSISHNAIGSTGVELLLKSLHHTSLKTLDLSSVIKNSHGSPVGLHLSRYMSQTDCCLESLRISDCCVNDDDITSVSRCMNSNTTLSSIDLSCNDDITCLALQQLLTTIQSHKLTIKKLDFSGCPLKSLSDTLAEALLMSMSSGLIEEVKLNGCGLKQDQNRLRQLSSQHDTVLNSIQNQICELYIK